MDLRIALNGPQLWTIRHLFDLVSGEPIRRRTMFLPWGRGVGKSWFRRQVWWTLVARYDGKLRADALKPLRGVRITSLMPTLKQFKDVHWADIETELSPGGPWGFLGAKLDKQAGQISFPGGSWVKPFPASAYNVRTARGMRTDLLDADECDDIDPAVYDSVAVPWLSEPWSLGIELPGGTPTRGRHGLWYRLLETGRLGDRLRRGLITTEQALALPAAIAIRTVFESLRAEDWPAQLPRDPALATLDILRGYYALHATYKNAPETVSPLAVARARATTPKATFEREWEANPDAGEGLVYPFDETFHVRLPPEGTTFTEYLGGGDHGWVDPGCLVKVGITGHGNDAVAWAVEESYGSEIPNFVWDARAATMFGDNVPLWADPSRPDRIFDFKKVGVKCRELEPHCKPIEAGVSRVADMLFQRVAERLGADGQPFTERWARMFVSPDCPNLIREFGLYRRKKCTDGTFSDEIDDKHNHGMDALRYPIVGRFGVPERARHVWTGGSSFG